MAKRENEFILNLKETLKANGRLLTIFGVAAIVIGGVTLVQYPQNWWIALLAVTGFFAALFLFINARAVIKMAVTVLLTLVLAGISFNLGSLVDPLGVGAFIWLFGHIIVFFLTLSVSYFLPSGQSRWTTISLTEIIYFSGTWLLIALTETVTAPAAVDILIAVGVFVLIYTFGSKSRFAAKRMPKTFDEPGLQDRMVKAADYADLKIHKLEAKEDSSYLVWNERAYILHPVVMEQAFGFVGKRKPKLSYQGKSINAWLRYLSFTKNPYFKSRGAETMLVLIDVNNANGKEPKTIGVTLPDSKALVPVGIIAGKLLKSDDEKALQKALLNLDVQFQEFVKDLTPKQKDALDKFGITEKTTPEETPNDR